MKIRIHIGYAVIAATYIATLLSILLGCRPLRRNWQINPDPGSKNASMLCMRYQTDVFIDLCQPAISRLDCLVTVVLNVITDMYLISIPLPVSCQKKSQLIWLADFLKSCCGGLNYLSRRKVFY
jgi:hypothetical protein